MNSTFAGLSKIRSFNLSQLNARQKAIVWAWVEVLAIVLWAMWLASPYLDTSTYMWPAGTGLGTKLLGHHFWIALQQCGVCALWNGTQNGGRPALADLFGSQLHPLVIITTLLWGVVGGAKIAIIGIMAMAGIAQWWIARLLKLSRIAGLWSALIAVGGGELITKNNEGNFGLMLSTAACSLAIAAVLALALNRRRKDTVVLAVMGALVIFSGQGYMQLTLLAWAPAVLFLWRRDDEERRFIRELLLAVGLAILIGAVLIVPSIHFWPNFTKETADPAFGFSEPLEYIPLNLVIRDYTFYISGNILGKQPFTDLQFIGWTPVLFALLSLRFVRRHNFGSLAFLACGAFMSIFVASAIPLRFLAPYIPFLLGFRFTSPMPGLAVPAVLALAAFGLDEVLKIKIPSLEFSLADLAKRSTLSFNVKWLLIIVLAISVKQIYDFSKTFIAVRDMRQIYQGLVALKTPQTEWVSPPGGEVDWTEPAINSGLKVTNLTYSGANWSGRDIPGPFLVAFHDGQPPDSVLAGDLLKIPLYRVPANEYAFVQTPDGQMTPCAAQAMSGSITVDCSATQAGQLIVREYAFSGWFAWRDNGAASLPMIGGIWLSVQAPAGHHVYRFSYLPWDVGVGLLMTIVGIVIAIRLFLQRRPPGSPMPEEIITQANISEPLPNPGLGA